MLTASQPTSEGNGHRRLGSLWPITEAASRKYTCAQYSADVQSRAVKLCRSNLLTCTKLMWDTLMQRNKSQQAVNASRRNSALRHMPLTVKGLVCLPSLDVSVHQPCEILTTRGCRQWTQSAVKQTAFSSCRWITMWSCQRSQERSTVIKTHVLVGMADQAPLPEDAHPLK